MTAIINLLVAAVLTFLALKYALGRGDPHQRDHAFLNFLLCTGMFQTGGFELAGINLSALRLLIWTGLAAYVYLSIGANHRKLPGYMLLYGLFLIYCGIQCLRAPDAIYGIRTFLKVLYPFPVMLIAWRCSHRGELSHTLSIAIVATLVISIFTSGVTERIFPLLVYNPFTTRVFWARATFADHAAIMVAAGLCLWWLRPGRSPGLLLGMAWLVCSPLAVASRTGLLATAAAISGVAFARYRTRALPVIAALVVGGAATFVFMDNFRASTFMNDKEITFDTIHEVPIANVNSTGRFNMWGLLLEKFFHDQRGFGSGLGSVQHHMYTQSQLYGGMKIAHSEYITLLCDLGLVGLVMYLCFAFFCTWRGFYIAWSNPDLELRVAGALTAASWLACLCALGFDNVFNYTLAAHFFPFAFTGIMEGMLKNERINHHVFRHHNDRQ